MEYLTNSDPDFDSASGVTVRFDDLTPGAPSAWQFVELQSIIEATQPEDVIDALTRAQDAALAGNWVAGFVSYEAASGLDATTAAASGLDATTEAASGLEPSCVPMVWFGVFNSRVAVEPIDAQPPARDAWHVDEVHLAFGRQWHRDSVATIRESIAAGDVYQVNLCDRARGYFSGDPLEMYRSLAHAQRAKYHTYISTPDFSIVSASPELFFEIAAPIPPAGRAIHTRPMKGTARRGRWPAEDRARAAALFDSPKERAENVMIVDLLRNDLGRVAQVGSVQVTDLLGLERYPTVWQLTSTVRATLRPDVTFVDVMHALFPCGSITGAPKLAAIAAIAAIEPEPRGVYCGAIGWLAPAKNTASAATNTAPAARFSVGIRTAVINARTGSLEYGAGGGITIDSEPAAEFDELRSKHRILTHPAATASILETMLWTPADEIELLELHLDRMERSAEYFAHPFVRDTVRTTILAVCTSRASTSPLMVRAMLNPHGKLDIELRDAPTVTGNPVRLAIHHQPIDNNDPRWYHKTTDRARYQLAKDDHPLADDVVLVNEHGLVTETTIYALAALVDGVWVTPPIEDGCLPSVATRAAVAHHELTRSSISVDQLRRASALKVGNAVRGWQLAVLVSTSAAGST